MSEPSPDWRACLEECGAAFAPVDGFPRADWAPFAAHFGDPQVEYTAGTESAAVFDLSDRTLIRVTGDDRVEFLNNFCTNDLKRLSPGDGCEAFLPTIKGRVLAHVFFFADTECVWIDSVPHAAGTILPHLERYVITEDVELTDVSSEFASLLATGPRSAELLQQAGMAIDLSSPGQHAEAAVESIGPVVVCRVDWFGQPAFLLRVVREQLPALWKRLLQVDGIAAGGALAYHVLRIAAGFPLHGVDITEDNLAQEVARDEQAISFTKGCYLGQEPIARIDAMGHVNRELRGLKLESGPCPQPGTVIVSPDDGKDIGRVTSAVQLSDSHPPLALGYVRSKFVTPGCLVFVETTSGRNRAVVFQRHSDGV